MPVLTVSGRAVTVDESFTKLSPEEQNATVEEIAKSLPAAEPSGVVAGARQGLAGLMSGPASTAKRILGIEAPAMEAAAESIAPKNYKSAPVLGPDSKWYDPTSYNWKNVPQMLAENSPQMAESIAAAKIGAKVHPLVGLAAGAVPFAVNALGDTAKNAAVNRTGDTATEPNTADKLRASGTVAAQSIPQMLAISRFMPGANKITQVGMDGAARAVGRAGATTAIEGGTGAVQEAMGQVGATLGTPGGVKLDTGQIAEQGVGNAILGAGFSAPSMARNALDARKYAKYGGENTGATEVFANRIKDAADGANLKNTKNGFNAVRQAHEDTITELKTAAAAAGPASPETTAALSRALKGRELSDADLHELQTNSTPDVARLAREAHVGSMLKGTGDYQGGKFAGGLAHGIGKHVRAYNAPISAGASAALGAATGGGHAASLFAYSPETLSALAGAYAAMRGVDALTGNRSPANKFVDKFSTDAALPTATQPQQPTVAPVAPQTTSVPQVTPPSPPAQPWGAPQAAPKQPWQTPQIGELWNGPNATALAMLKKRLKEGLPPEATPTPLEAPKAQWQTPQIGELWSGPNPTAAAMLKKKLKDGLPVEEAPPTPEAPAVPSFNPTALAMLKRRLKAGLLTDPAQAPVATDEAPAAPNFNPTALAMLKKRLTAGLPPEAAPAPDESTIPSFLPNDIPSFLPKRAADIPAAPTLEDVPQFLPNRNAAAPSISSLMDNMRARYPVAAQAAAPDAAPVQITKKKGRVKEKASPAPVEATMPVYEDNPYPQKVSDRPAPVDHVAKAKKLTAHEEANQAYDLTNEYVPLQANELYGQHLTHDEFAAKETSDKLGQVTEKGTPALEKEKAKAYHDGVVSDRVKRERILQELSHLSVTEKDTPALQALLEQLHHIRRGSVAKAAIYHYASLMSTPLRTKVLKRLDNSLVHSMWSKFDKDE